LPFYPTDADKAIAVVYDLRDASQWTDADEERRILRVRRGDRELVADFENMTVEIS